MTDFERHSTDDALLLALVKGATVRSAAEQAGLSEATAFRRLRNPEFVAELNRVRGELWNAALGKLTEASGKAVDRLVMLVDEGDTHAVRLSAAVRVLEIGIKLRGSVEITTRLDRLERDAAGQKYQSLDSMRKHWGGADSPGVATPERLRRAMAALAARAGMADETESGDQGRDA